MQIFSLPVESRYAYARASFNIDAVSDAELHLGVRYFAMVWVNGTFAGRTYVRHHDNEMRYEAFNIAPYLKVGENVVALLLHAWGEPEYDIPGILLPTSIMFATGGNAGGCNFADASSWRIAAADEYLPSRRPNGIIGHEEVRDMRLELQGWTEPGFDDKGWQLPNVNELDGVTFLPSPLRPLCEELVSPQRIVKQGKFCEASAFISSPVNKSDNIWRINYSIDSPQKLTFYFNFRLGMKIWVDGEEKQYHIDPPLPWVEIYQPIFLDLSAGEHVITGTFPPPTEFQLNILPFGWDVCPSGGDRVEWSASTAGVFTEGKVKIDPDRRPMIDVILPENRCILNADGAVNLTVEDEDFAVIFEFPKSITMLPRLEIADATAGVQVDVVYSERLSGVKGLTLPAAYIDRVILRDGPQNYEVSFQYKSARILVIIVRAKGGRAVISKVNAIYRHYDYENTGQFVCNEPRLNSVWEICRNTMEFGSQDIIMDGPWREQLLYIGDNIVHNMACYHLFGNHEIVEWQHTLYAQGQMPDGIFQPNQPCITTPEQYRLLDQTILWPIQLEQHLQYTGRKDFIFNLLPNVVKLMNGFQTLFTVPGDPRLRNVTGWNWVDHPGLEDGKVRSIRHEGIPTAINILQYSALKSSVNLLNLAGNTADAKRFQKIADELKLFLQKYHWDANRKVFVDCVVDGKLSPEVSVHVNLLAIEAGLVDDPNDCLDRTWKQPGVLQMCGPFFRVHLFEVLHQLGRIPEMLAEIRELWGGFVDSGLTSTPENHEINGDWESSVGHPWGASPATYLVKSIAGITPLTPGWDTIEFDPQMCDLQSLKVTVPTPHGPVTANLQKNGEKTTGTLTIPKGIKVVVKNENCVQLTIDN
ncbi:MAG: alpha-L-rhamnosidase C-terminal domain-containing protein [bacterium]